MEWTTVSVTLSLITGLALTRLLSGLVAVFRARRRAEVDWLPIAWVAILIVAIMESWSALNGLPHVSRNFSFPEYLLLGIFMMLLFAAAALLVPPGEIGTGESLRDYFEQEGRFALPLFSAFLAGGALVNVFLFGASTASAWFILDVPMVILPLVVFAGTRLVQVVFTAAYVPLFALDLAVSLQAT